MKVKLDHVTNSSSTSFVVWGTRDFNLNNKDLLAKIFEVYTTTDDYNGESFEEFCNYKLWEKCDIIAENIRSIKSDLDISTGPEGDYPMIGIPPEEMKLDEKLSEFKERIKRDLKNIGIEVDDKNIYFISETWYN
jgi:hypothetical protein